MFENDTQIAEPIPMRTKDIKSYLVKASPRSLQESILLKTRFKEEVELRVIMSAYERLPINHE